MLPGGECEVLSITHFSSGVWYEQWNHRVTN